MIDPQLTYAQGRAIVTKRIPYFRSMVLSLARVEHPGLGTIGVTQDLVLMVDWEFIKRVNPEEMAGLFAHECLHVFLHHPKRIAGKGWDPVIANLAADLVVNPMVEEMGLKLPGGDLRGVYPEDFGFPRGLTQDEYYDRLRKQASGSGGVKQAQSPGVTHGKCGSCAGNPNDGEPSQGKGGKAKEARSEAEVARIVRSTAAEIRDMGARGRGTVPAGLQRWADELLEPAEVDWRQKIGHVTRAAVAWRSTPVDHRYDGPSRRQAGLGYGPGVPILPRFRQPVPNVDVIVDTSGSMGRTELNEVMTEVNGILRALGANIRVCSCDAAVHGITKVKSVAEALNALKGGGGTDMRPAFRALMKENPRPEVIVVGTDGMVGDIGPEPVGVKVIWLVVGRYQDTSTLRWGEVIQIKERKGK